MPFPRFTRRTQVVPVNIGPARADQAYEDRLIEQAIATREAARQQNELEAQRLEARRLLYSTLGNRQAQLAAARLAVQESQATITQAEASRLDPREIRRRQYFTDRPTIPFTDQINDQINARESGQHSSSNVVVLEHDQFGPILPTRQLVGQQIHPGYTGNWEADFAFWDNQVGVEYRRLDYLHTRYPVLNNYAHVPLSMLKGVLDAANPPIPEDVIREELITHHNFKQATDNQRTYGRNLEASRIRSNISNPTQTSATSKDYLTEAEIIEKRAEFYDLHKRYNEVRKLQGEDDEEIPENLLCPISIEFMVEPSYEAFAKQKNTYERANILRHINIDAVRRPQPLDPFTRVPIYGCTLLPDTARKKTIAQFKEKMLRYIEKYNTRQWEPGGLSQKSNLASGKKLRKLIQSIKKRKSKQAKQAKQAKQTKQRKQTKQANRTHAKLSKKYTMRHH
jgi:hypothetical protein